MKKLNCDIYDFKSCQPYEERWHAMQQFCQQASEDALDQLWLLEHQPVFTQGKAGKAEHVLNPHNIPVIQTDRGGQVTYHGPGQLMIYTLLNVDRLQLNSRQLVNKMESFIIDLLLEMDIKAENNPKAPGVYTNNAKIASIGLRITRGWCYHGMALNVNMDMEPFQWINPCGYKNQPMAQIKDFIPNITIEQVKAKIITAFCHTFDYNASVETA